MKTYRVDFTPSARQDLIDYATYIAAQEGSEAQSLAWFDGMYNAVMSLDTLPRRCPVARENAAFQDEIRQLVHQSHRVLFSVHDDQGLVAIHRIWHAARENAKPEDLPDVH